MIVILVVIIVVDNCDTNKCSQFLVTTVLLVSQIVIIVADNCDTNKC